MKNIYLFGALLTMATLFGSCKKDEKPSNTDKITDKNWALTAATISPGLPNSSGGGPITNLYNTLRDCDKDDQIRLTKALTYTNDEGSTRCATTDPQVIETGTWSWASNETIVRLQPSRAGAPANELRVDELSTSKLVVRSTETSGGVVYEITSTYQPK